MRLLSAPASSATLEALGTQSSVFEESSWWLRPFSAQAGFGWEALIIAQKSVN